MAPCTIIHDFITINMIKNIPIKNKIVKSLKIALDSKNLFFKQYPKKN
jgi:hypothetical protein